MPRGTGHGPGPGGDNRQAIYNSNCLFSIHFWNKVQTIISRIRQSGWQSVKQSLSQLVSPFVTGSASPVIKLHAKELAIKEGKWIWTSLEAVVRTPSLSHPVPLIGKVLITRRPVHHTYQYVRSSQYTYSYVRGMCVLEFIIREKLSRKEVRNIDWERVSIKWATEPKRRDISSSEPYRSGTAIDDVSSPLSCQLTLCQLEGVMVGHS